MTTPYAPDSRMHHADVAAISVMPEFTGAEQESPAEEEFTVNTRERRPGHMAFNTVVIAAGMSARLLGRNDKRRNAIVSCVSGTAIITVGGNLAGAVMSMSLGSTPTGNVPGAWLTAGTPGAAVPIGSTESIFAVATTGGSAAVSVIEEWWD